jgi:hypothetical protein
MGINLSKKPAVCGIVLPHKVKATIANRFLRVFVSAFVWIVGLPTAILALPFLLGIQIEQNTIDSVLKFIQNNGPQLFALFVFGIAVFTRVKVVTEDRAEYEKNFYEINSEARLQKAYYVFFNLGKRQSRQSRSSDRPACVG